MGMNGQRHAPAALSLRNFAGTQCTGGWVGPRAGLVGQGKQNISIPNQCSNPGPSSPQRVAILTTLSRPQSVKNT